jgi:hypothetical protein
MNAEEMQHRNNLLAQISALNASIKALEMVDNKENKKLLDANKKIIIKVEKELEAFDKKLADAKKKEDEEKRIVERQRVENAFKSMNDYFAHLAKLDPDDMPDMELKEAFMQSKRMMGVKRRLRVLGL